MIVQVMVHTLDRKSEARLRASKVEPDVEELASTPLSVKLKTNDRIKMTLQCDGVKIKKSVQITKWNGRIVSICFPIFIPKIKDINTIHGTILDPGLRIFVNGIPAG